MKSSVPQRIMILRLSAVGDTILSMPILCELRRRFPESKIAWVVGQGAADLLRGHQDLDQLLVLSKKDSASPGAYLRFLNQVRAWRPDTTIDAQGLTKSAWIGRTSGAKLRIGMSKSEFEGRELSTWLNNNLVTPCNEQVVLRGLELLKPLGIEDPMVQYKVPRYLETIESVDRKLRELHAAGPWGIINVGAGWPSKIWPTDRYAAIARHLGQRWGLPSWIAWGGPQERTIAQELEQTSDGWAKMMPQTSLVELAEWVRRAKLFVGSDTGPMHLSVALDIPTIALIGPMPAERVGPLGAMHATVQIDRLSEKERSQRKTDLRPMLSIQIEHVQAACDRICQEISMGQTDLKAA